MRQKNLTRVGLMLVLLALMAIPSLQPTAWAESNVSVGGSPTARLNFSITIPTILVNIRLTCYDVTIFVNEAVGIELT